MKIQTIKMYDSLENDENIPKLPCEYLEKESLDKLDKRKESLILDRE